MEKTFTEITASGIPSISSSNSSFLEVGLTDSRELGGRGNHCL